MGQIRTQVGESLVLVEVSALEGPADVAFDRSFSFEEFETSLHNLAVGIRNALRHVAPDKIAVEFGVEVGVESGKLTALLVKGTAGANIKVGLEWAKDDAEK